MYAHCLYSLFDLFNPASCASAVVFPKNKKDAKAINDNPFFIFLSFLEESRRVHAAVLVKQFKTYKELVRTAVVMCQLGGFTVVAVTDHQSVVDLESCQSTPCGIKTVGGSQSQLVVDQEVGGKIRLKRCAFHRS